MALFGRGGAAAERRGTPADLLVVGLGNPGAEYEGSRHNVGAQVVDVLADRHGGTLKRSKERALVAEVRIDDKRVTLAFPQTFMNLSGESVALLARRHGITDPAQIVVVQDAVDQGAPAHRRVPAGAHRGRQTGRQAAGRGPRAQARVEARARRARHRRAGGRRRGRADRVRWHRRGDEPGQLGPRLTPAARSAARSARAAARTSSTHHWRTITAATTRVNSSPVPQNRPAAVRWSDRRGEASGATGGPGDSSARP